MEEEGEAEVPNGGEGGGAGVDLVLRWGRGVSLTLGWRTGSAHHVLEHVAQFAHARHVVVPDVP